MAPAYYDLCFLVQGEELHIPLEIVTSSQWRIHNHKECIDLTVTENAAGVTGAFIAEIPFFRTRLIGQWENDSRANGRWEDAARDSSYWTYFTISSSPTPAKKPCESSDIRKYKTVFHNPSDTTEALGQFTFCNDQVTGTLMTETGDYRHLHGSNTRDTLKFGTFDGSTSVFF